MLRILAAIVVITFLIFFARWQRENPPDPIGTPNAISEQVAEGLAGSAVRAKATSSAVIKDVGDKRQQQLDELNNW